MGKRALVAILAGAMSLFAAKASSQNFNGNEIYNHMPLRQADLSKSMKAYGENPMRYSYGSFIDWRSSGNASGVPGYTSC